MKIQVQLLLNIHLVSPTHLFYKKKALSLWKHSAVYDQSQKSDTQDFFSLLFCLNKGKEKYRVEFRIKL